MKCTNPNCLYEWAPKVKNPKSCPRCRQYLRHRNVGERNGQWKGKDVKYGSLHDYIKYHKTKPDLCERCGEEKRLDLANKSGDYLRELNDWEWLCRKCHMTSDGRIEKLPGMKKGGKHTEVSLQRMSDSQKKVVHTKEWAQKISSALKKYNSNPDRPTRRERGQYLKSSKKSPK